MSRTTNVKTVVGSLVRKRVFMVTTKDSLALELEEEMLNCNLLRSSATVILLLFRLFIS